MAEIFGTEISGIPTLDVSGFFSTSWIWIGLVILIGMILIVGVALILFFTTYNRKVIVFENISGQGYQPVMRTRARVIRLGMGGEEVLKTLKAGRFVTAYGRKMGKNTYWFAKGQDGYLYNFLMGDLDAKLSILDIEPVDRDVRMFYVALDRLSHLTYAKTKFFEKYAVHLLLFAFLVVLILGMWFIVGKIGDAVAPLGTSSEVTLEITEKQLTLTERLDNLARTLKLKVEETIPEPSGLGGSGLVEAPPEET
jgi:hypothetical protein|tara:strand:+ start:119 stop:877 length:759 start_codon:yes stop_codon:yes gene_type:complete